MFSDGIHTWIIYGGKKMKEIKLMDLVGLNILLGILCIIMLVSVCGWVVFGAEVDTTKAVLHHSATNVGTVESIRYYHVHKKGWDDIGYHKVIERTGQVKDGRPLNIKGAHARTGKPYSRNHYVGICLVGGDTFADAQQKALIKLLKDMKITYVERHHDKCPGSGLNVESIQKVLDETP